MEQARGVQDPRHSAQALGIALGCVAFVAVHWFDAPRPRYLPQTGAWSLVEVPPQIAMTFYGTVLWGLLGTVTGWALARVPPIARWLARPTTAAAVSMSAAAAVIASLLYFLLVYFVIGEH